MQLQEPKKSVGDRRIEFEWPLTPQVRLDGRTEQTFAVLAVTSLHPERKGYVASLRNETETRYDDSPGAMRSFSLFDSVSIDTVLAPRFSRAKLAEVADQALAKLRERAEADDETVLKYLAIAAKVGEPVAA